MKFGFMEIPRFMMSFATASSIPGSQQRHDSSATLINALGSH